MKYDIETVCDIDGSLRDMDRIADTLKRFFKGGRVWITVTNVPPWEEES